MTCCQKPCIGQKRANNRAREKEEGNQFNTTYRAFDLAEAINLQRSSRIAAQQEQETDSESNNGINDESNNKQGNNLPSLTMSTTSSHQTSHTLFLLTLEPSTLGRPFLMNPSDKVGCPSFLSPSLSSSLLKRKEEKQVRGSFMMR